MVAMSIDEKVYKILFLYITQKYFEDTMFCCLSGCNKNLITYIQNNLDILKNYGKEYHIMAIYEEKFNFSFNEIVKIRNNKEIKRIVIFTNGSISHIDSLKDFKQIDIKQIEFLGLWDIIQDVCSITWEIPKNNDNNIVRFLDDLTEIIKPELYKLIEYIEKVNTDRLAYNSLVLALNRNLFIFDIWSSSSNKILRKTKLRTLFINSVPSQIHQKITSPRDIEKIQRKENLETLEKLGFGHLNSQKNILKTMFYNREYKEAYEKVYYELVEDILTGSVKKQNKEREEETVYSYTNLYNLTLSKLSNLENISIKDEQVKSIELNLKDNFMKEESFNLPIQYTVNGQVKNEDISINLEDAQTKWERFQEIFINKKFEDEILLICDDLNIYQEDKDVLKEKLKQYLEARMDFINKRINPVFLESLLDESMLYITSFFDLIKVLYNFKQATLRSIAINGLLNKLISIDFELQDDGIYVPYYNPILIFHLHIMRSRYKRCLMDVNLMNAHRFKILEQINTKIQSEHVVYKSKMYLLSQDNNEFPYYVRYVPEEFVDSKIRINFNVISSYILKYLQDNPYKNILRICLIGEVDYRSLKNILFKIIERKGNSNLIRFRVKIITKSPNDVRRILTLLFEQKELLNKIECNIERIDKNIKKEGYIEDLIDKNDIIMFLDSRLIYFEPQFNKRNSDDLERNIRYRYISSEINNFSYHTDGKSDKMPIIPNVINALLNSAERKELQYSELNLYNLDTNIISSINRALNQSKYNDKKVLLLSSDYYIDEKVLDNNNLVEIDEAMNENDKIKILTFCKFGKEKEEYKFENNRQAIWFTGNDLLDSFIIDDDFIYKNIDLDIDIIENTKYCLSYGNFPQLLEVICYSVEESLNNNTSKNLYDTFIEPSIIQKLFLDYYNKETFIKLLLHKAKTEEDIVFIYSFENNLSSISVNYSIRKDVKEIYSTISSINRNTVYRILKFLGQESISEQGLNTIKELLRNNNFSIKNLSELRNIVSKYNHNDMKYLLDNLNVVIKNLEDE